MLEGLVRFDEPEPQDLHGMRYVVTREVMEWGESYFRRKRAGRECERLNARRWMPTHEWQVVPGGWKWYLVCYQCKALPTIEEESAA